MFLRLIIVLILSAWAFASDITCPVVDKSPKESPMRNSGVVEVTLIKGTSNSLMMSREDNWKAVNVSSKSIVAFIETLSLRLPEGHMVNRVARYEAFFHPSIIGPNGVADMYSRSREVRVEGAQAEDSRTICEVRIDWVQFDDGSFFGDPSYAVELFRDRRETWKELARLDNIYGQQGQAAFATALARHASSSVVDAYLEHLRIFQKEHDADAVINRLEEHLKMARLRSALLPDPKPEP